MNRVRIQFRLITKIISDYPQFCQLTNIPLILGSMLRGHSAQMTEVGRPKKPKNWNSQVHLVFKVNNRQGSIYALNF
jgi:hypothetical protein